MEKSILNNFIQYLQNFGFISYESSYQLYIIYEDISSKENNMDFTTLMYNSLLSFINKMNEEQLKFLSYNIINNYFKNRFFEKKNKLKSIFNIIVGNQKVLLLKILTKWSNKKKLINNNKKNNLNTKIKNSKSKIELNLIESNIKFYKTKNKKLESFIIKKEEKGKVNLNKRKKINSLPNHNYSIFEGLNEFMKDYNKNQMKIKKNNSLNHQQKSSDLSNITFRKRVSKDKKKKNNNEKNIQLIKLRKKQIRKHNLSDDYKIENPINQKISNNNNKLNNYLNSLITSKDKNDNLNHTIQYYLNDYNKRNNTINNTLNFNSCKTKYNKICKSCDYEKINDLENSIKNKSFNYSNYDSSYISTQDFTNKSEFQSQNKRNKKINKIYEKQNDVSIEKFSQLEREEIVKKMMDKLYSKKDNKQNFNE